MALYEELEADQGSTFRYRIDLTQENGDAYDLTGYDVTGQVKKTYKSTTVAATFSVQKNSSGRIILTLTDEQTAAMPAGRYVYDVYIESSGGGSRYRVMEGIMNVTPSVTD